MFYFYVLHKFSGVFEAFPHLSCSECPIWHFFLSVPFTSTIPLPLLLPPDSSTSSLCCCLLHCIFLCQPLFCLPYCLLPTIRHLPPSLCCLVDSLYCLFAAGIPSEENPCCGPAMLWRACCRGEPDATGLHNQFINCKVCGKFLLGGLFCTYNLTQKLHTRYLIVYIHSSIFLHNVLSSWCHLFYELVY